MKNTYGEGSIYKDSRSGNYVAAIIVGYNEYGKPKRKYFSSKTKKGAIDKKNDYLMSVHNGTYVDKSIKTLKELVYLNIDTKLRKNKISEATYYRQEETIKQLSPLWNYRIQLLNTKIIDDYFCEVINKYSQSTIDKIFRMLNQAFKIAVKDKILSNNPMLDFERPRSSIPKKKIRALNQKEHKKLVACIKKHPMKYQNQILFSLYSGMRMGEINALTVKDIVINDDENDSCYGYVIVNKTITRNKTGRAIIKMSPKTDAGIRKVEINKLLKTVIDEVLKAINTSDPNAYLFQNKGKLISTQTVNKYFTDYLEKHQIIDPYCTIDGDVTTHSLRHTFATRAIESGMHAKVLQKILGHSSINVTLDTYSDVFEEFQKDNNKKFEEYLKTFEII